MVFAVATRRVATATKAAATAAALKPPGSTASLSTSVVFAAAATTEKHQPPNSVVAIVSAGDVSNNTQRASSSSSSSNVDGSTGGGVDDDLFEFRPNKLTTAVQAMEGRCPDTMTTYARCVVDRHNNSEESLSKGDCGEEFRMVMECFRSVRYGDHFRHKE